MVGWWWGCWAVLGSWQGVAVLWWVMAWYGGVGVVAGGARVVAVQRVLGQRWWWRQRAAGGGSMGQRLDGKGHGRWTWGARVGRASCHRPARRGWPRRSLVLRLPVCSRRHLGGVIATRAGHARVSHPRPAHTAVPPLLTSSPPPCHEPISESSPSLSSPSNTAGRTPRRCVSTPLERHTRCPRYQLPLRRCALGPSNQHTPHDNHTCLHQQAVGNCQYIVM